MYQSSDVLAYFNGVCSFLETVVQHASHQKEETIYCLCLNNVRLSANTWFRVVLWIITLSELSTVRHN
jgi:hypothetical protein